MADSKRNLSSRERVKAHREQLRRLGLRPIQIWLPDVRSRSFKDAAHQQSVAVANSPQAEVDQHFVDAISDWNSE